MAAEQSGTNLLSCKTARPTRYYWRARIYFIKLVFRKLSRIFLATRNLKFCLRCKIWDKPFVSYLAVGALFSPVRSNILWLAGLYIQYGKVSRPCWKSNSGLLGGKAALLPAHHSRCPILLNAGLGPFPGKVPEEILCRMVYGNLNQLSYGLEVCLVPPLFRTRLLHRNNSYEKKPTTGPLRIESRNPGMWNQLVLIVKYFLSLLCFLYYTGKLCYLALN